MKEELDIRTSKEISGKPELGLYTPQLEKDSCGVGLIAKVTNEASHWVLDSALTMLENMEHRGACGFEENTGDGAGILTQLPHYLFDKLLNASDANLPERGKYGVGMIFFPRDKVRRLQCESIIQKYAYRYDFKIFFDRLVPTSNAALGSSAISTEPVIKQYFFKNTSFSTKPLEKRFYLLRSAIMKKVYASHPELRDDFYIASLSSRTIVYKGMLTAHQLRHYYSDLTNEDYTTAVSIVHSRFSTNTIPKWKLAQPFRCIAHNGEINTIQGNMNWWNAREKYIKKVAKKHKSLTKVFPVCDPYISDSGNFDNVVDFLMQTSRSIPHSMMIMIPEAWQNDDTMDAHKKAFYQYHDAVMEPWDGPASICFTDGVLVGATLDRNGLRPSRYMITSDDLLILGSETGCLELNPAKIIAKGRLEPGKILLADLDEQRIISDEEIKRTISQRKPYQTWLSSYAECLENLKHSAQLIKPKASLIERQLSAGMSKEDEKLILNSMVQKSKEPLGSMGADIPLAILSTIPQHLANYFKQQFAQVTNPPLDSIREKFYMSLSTVIGGGSKILNIGPREANVIRCDSPILDLQSLSNLMSIDDENFRSCMQDVCYHKSEPLEEVLDEIGTEVLQKIEEGYKIICLSDVSLDKDRVSIPSLMITGALHHRLVKKGLRKEVTLVVKMNDIWETHHAAVLLSYGADLICPYLAEDAAESISIEQGIEIAVGWSRYKSALEKGILKIMSKLGVSTLASYKGAQTFEALGIGSEVVAKCFTGTISRIGGMSFTQLQREQEEKHRQAFTHIQDSLPLQGIFQWRKKGEYHLFNPTTIHLLQHSTRQGDYKIYKAYANALDKLETNASTLRSFLRFKSTKSIPLDEVESSASIMKRFATGAMSFGSISWEAHTTLAKAMNRIGAKSNSGEGGEDPERYITGDPKSNMNSAIKQIASGRFGVNLEYLNQAKELQIKIAQGAKPGEGGQLPGHKVDNHIAKVRNSTPGVGLISPPPHHDIYSIEDLAQLIFDLKNVNEEARISVKLVSKSGVGVIASGVTKAFADHILISGYDGGTGASPLSSIRHAGLPWELGLSETHQTLMKNGLRDRVCLQTDGQLRTGRDLAIASLLGAEEWGIATAALVVEGCVLMRKCHLNTCPVGIATQNPRLREKFAGKVEHLVNYFQFLADHLREIMAELGIRKVNDLIGRTDLLEIVNSNKHWKTEHLDLSALLVQQENKYNNAFYCKNKQSHQIEKLLDHQLIKRSENALRYNKSYASVFPIKNTDRVVGTMLSHTICEKYGAKGLPTDTLTFKFVGSAGQSFGAFGAPGISLHIEGDANDYFGKGLSGAKLSVRPDKKAGFSASEQVIIGNVALYGATSGEAYIDGHAGDRFCVRNSGAKVVVESIGANGCEYMTGGRVVILGSIGKNFAAGMSGGISYLYKPSFIDLNKINKTMIYIEKPSEQDVEEIRSMLRNHVNNTGSSTAMDILRNWESKKLKFQKVIPIEYKKVIEHLGKENLKLKKAI